MSDLDVIEAWESAGGRVDEFAEAGLCSAGLTYGLCRSFAAPYASLDGAVYLQGS